MTDCTDKRLDYVRYGIPEYWRFDPSVGDHYEVALAADRLVDGMYEPLEVEQLGEGVWRGYSETLRLHVCLGARETAVLRLHDRELSAQPLGGGRSCRAKLDVTLSPGRTVPRPGPQAQVAA